MHVIVYKGEDGLVRIIYPISDCGLSIEDIALKDVPAGLPYKIMDSNHVPEDTAFMAAWDIDLTDHDGVGADYGVGSLNAVACLIDGYVMTLPIEKNGGQSAVNFSEPVSIFQNGMLIKKVANTEAGNDNR